MTGGEAGLKSQSGSGVFREADTLKSAVTHLVMDNDLLRERIRQLEEEKPFVRRRSRK